MLNSSTKKILKILLNSSSNLFKATSLRYLKARRNILILVLLLLIATLSLTLSVQSFNKVISVKYFSLSSMIQNAQHLFGPVNPLAESYKGGMPIARAGTMMAYDPISKDDILFGGASFQLASVAF